MALRGVVRFKGSTGGTLAVEAVLFPKRLERDWAATNPGAASIAKMQRQLPCRPMRSQKSKIFFTTNNTLFFIAYIPYSK